MTKEKIWRMAAVFMASTILHVVPVYNLIPVLVDFFMPVRRQHRALYAHNLAVRFRLGSVRLVQTRY